MVVREPINIGSGSHGQKLRTTQRRMHGMRRCVGIHGMALHTWRIHGAMLHTWRCMEYMAIWPPYALRKRMAEVKENENRTTSGLPGTSAVIRSSS